MLRLKLTVSFVSPPHAISLSVTKQPSAYVGEILPLVVKITSDDDRELTGKLSVFLQPGDEDDGKRSYQVAINAQKRP